MQYFCSPRVRPELSVTVELLKAEASSPEGFERAQSSLCPVDTCPLCLWSPETLLLMLIGHQSSEELGVLRCFGYIMAAVHASLVTKRLAGTHSALPC